jgi:two-component system, LuxR family, sensor kinase FixL
MDLKKRWLVALLYVPAYVTLDWISYIQPVLKLGITPWSPQTGLTVAFLLWMGPRWAVCTAVAAFLSELLVRHAPAGPLTLALASVWIAGSYAACCAMLGKGVVRDAMQGLVAAVRFVVVSLLASLVAAIGYVGLFVLAQSLPIASAAGSVIRYGVGDVNGILMLAPLLIALPRLSEALAALRAGWPQAALQSAVIVLFVWLLFGIDAADQLRIFYPLFVPVIWIAVRWGVTGALLAVLAIQVGIIVAMRDAVADVPLIDLQILMLTLTLTGLLLGAVVAERAQARAAALEREQQLARAMRFAVAGELASSLTHELNQPITALVSYLQASQIMTPATGVTDKRLSDTLAKATHEAIRASEVMKRLRDFYQGGASGRGPTDVAGCCTSVVEFLAQRLKAQGVRVLVHVAPELPQVGVDRTQLEMVLHNLMTNAIDAVGGQVVREVQLRAVRGDGVLQLEVHDSGPGVAPDALPMLFEPFNTTKSDGMGLGLAISRNLVRAQGGELGYRPSPLAAGACFVVLLPLVA